MVGFARTCVRKIHTFGIIIMKLLITGANGIVGTILTQALSEKYDVIGTGRSGEETNRYLKMDISEAAAVEAVFKKVRPEAVIHLAGDSRVSASWDSVLKNNIVGTKNILEAARRHGASKIVYASSTHITGAYEGNPRSLHLEENPHQISVNDPIRPDSYYGTSKAFGEALARQYFENFGMHTICLRIGLVTPENDPTKDPRMMKIWLSHRDLVQIVEKSLETNVAFGIYYAISANTGRYWDISNAQRELGYQPEDDAALIS